MRVYIIVAAEIACVAKVWKHCVYEELSQRVVENIVKAYRVLIGIAKREIPENILKEVLREVQHIAIHELAHGAIRVIYPEIDELEDTVLGTCIDEIVARLLDRYLRT